MTGTATAPSAILRKLNAGDLPSALELSQMAGWPHRLEDWRFVFALGEGVAIADGGGLNAMAMWWPFGPLHAALGMIIVRPDHQGQGLGRRLMAGLFEQTGTRSLRLNATQAGLALYKSCGFSPVGEINQHQGVALQVPPPQLRPGAHIRPATSGDHAAICALDVQASGLPRHAMLGALAEAGEIIVLMRANDIAGFSTIRRFGRGSVIGPVIASDPEDARALIQHWIAARPGQFLRIDTPGDSGLRDWLSSGGLAYASSVVTMTRGAPAQAKGASRIFALVNQALG